MTSKVLFVESTSTTLKENMYSFENDSIRISYNFWSEDGSMSFIIYNKLNIPIYIDWKKSAFIPNEKMISYWQDETNTVSSYSGSNSVAYGVNYTNGRSKSKSIKEERIDMITPHAFISKYSFKILPKPNFPGTDQIFDIHSTPLKFRNYIAVSTTEQFDKNVFYVDNDFYIHEVMRCRMKKLYKYKSPHTFHTKPM
jgi:hypothetical protein